MSYNIIIPARYASTRFPGKPLSILAGKSVLQHVVERARQSQAQRIVMATDDERIRDAAEAISVEVCMTSPEHSSGTERLAEVVQTLELADDEIVVNLQGDEPFMPAECLDQVAAMLGENNDCGMATLCHLISTRDEIDNPNIVKLIMDAQQQALYFSRAPIPWNRDQPQSVNADYYRHIGLYAYSVGFLKRYIDMSPCALEQIEALEQLRVLWHGEKIKVAITNLDTGIGIDTPEDLARAESYLQQQ